MNARFIRLQLITLFAAASGQAAVAATFQDLARLIPDQANALVLMDVEQILATPLAQRQGWARKLETAYVQRPVVYGAQSGPTSRGTQTCPYSSVERHSPCWSRSSTPATSAPTYWALAARAGRDATCRSFNASHSSGDGAR